MDVFTSLAIVLLAASATGIPTNSSTRRVSREFNNTAVFIRIIPSEDLSIRDAIYITPELVFKGKQNGDILRCLYKDPGVCEMFYSYSSSTPVTAIVINGEFLYASLNNGVMLRCSLHEKNSCTVFNNHNQMNALVISGGYIHAGMQDGRMLRCELNQPSTCRTLNTFSHAVASLAASGRYIYAGLTSKEIYRCSIGSENSCRLYTAGSVFGSHIVGLLAYEEFLIGVSSGGYAFNCTHKGNCTQVRAVPGSSYTNTVAFDGSLYAVQSSYIWVCKWGVFNCSLYDNHAGVVSLAFAYRTYKMQERYALEGKTCLNDARCPPFMTYYAINERPILEVFVKDGRLYNSQGVLVDTRDADVGQSGRAAIFAMGADGQLLLSNVHYTVLRTSSLFAGNPVAAAGEIVVEDGVIKSIRACSYHYSPDVELNQQLVDVLAFKGYKERINSLPCYSNNDGHHENVEENTISDVQ